MVEFNRVIDGLSRYLNNNFYSKLNDWQEVFARIAVGRIIGNPEALKQSLQANPFVRTFAVMDSEGNVDLESLARDLKREIERKGKISVEVPMFGKMSFVAADIDDIYREITGGIL
jgi:hypothetical protein